MTVRIVGSSWVQKPWRPSEQVIRRVKVVGRHGCTLREATWAPRRGSTRWWKVKIVVVVRVSGRWCVIGWSRSPCERRCIVRRILIQRRVPPSEGSPIDDVFPLDLVEWNVTLEKMVVMAWVIGEHDSH